MAEPLIIVNLKAYAEGMGEGAGIIAAAAEEIGEESGVAIGVPRRTPNSIRLLAL